ncbi:unnamed protein product [Phytophthora fragariaefolia]|nr:unnamed protein product [Phytophthora fragariaefolia]
MDDAFIESLGGKLTLEAIDHMALREFGWGALTSEFETVWDEYPHLSKDVAAPKCELEDIAHSPAMLFFYFVPKSLWVSTTKETNRRAVTRRELLRNQVDGDEADDEGNESTV